MSLLYYLKRQAKRGHFSDPQRCRGIPNTDYRCCSKDNRCGIGMGDCDDDTHCFPGLKCGTDNCWSDFRIQNGFNWDFQADCCYGMFIIIFHKHIPV